MAYHRLVDPEGETATARAAGRAGALLVAGIFASRTLEDIAAAATGPLWLQLYWLRRRDALAALVDRAGAAGYRAQVLTVDAPRVGRRLRGARNGFAVPPGIRAVNLDAGLTAASHRADAGASGIETHAREQFDPSLTWADLAWLRERSTLPLVLKGILAAEDARLAAEHGVDAVVVSNHGGRQLDGALPSLAALPEVAAPARCWSAARCSGGSPRRGRRAWSACSACCGANSTTPWPCWAAPGCGISTGAHRRRGRAARMACELKAHERQLRERVR